MPYSKTGLGSINVCSQCNVLIEPQLWQMHNRTEHCCVAIYNRSLYWPCTLLQQQNASRHVSCSFNLRKFSCPSIICHTLYGQTTSYLCCMYVVLNAKKQLHAEYNVYCVPLWWLANTGQIVNWLWLTGSWVSSYCDSPVGPLLVISSFQETDSSRLLHYITVV